ncbi:MAG: hypothetical protein HWE25_16200 [Alphaproteobacteria bacterium]|nr:hypothetical protein [Alphaproteobacteria bacterium]
MGISIPLLPALLCIAIAGLLFAKFRKFWPSMILVMGISILYVEHINRAQLIAGACQKHAIYHKSGAPSLFAGVYLRLPRKYTWQELDEVIKQIPLNTYGKSALAYVDADIAESNFYTAKRHRFSVAQPRIYRGRKVCGVRNNSAWYGNEAYTEIRDRLMKRDICFSIAQVKTGPDVQAKRCKSGQGWKECTYFDVVEMGPAIPTYRTEVQDLEFSNWMSSVSAKAETKILEGTNASWTAMSGALKFRGDINSWLVRLQALLGGDRSLIWQCNGYLLLPTVMHELRNPSVSASPDG